MGGQPQQQSMSPKGGPQQQNQGWTTAPQTGQGMSGPGAGSAKGGGMSPYQSGVNSTLSGLQSTAPMQYMQIQNMPPGPQRDALIRQTQGSDNGAGFNAAMKGAGYTLNPNPVNGMYTYNAPAGGGNTFTGGGSPGYQNFGMGGPGSAKGGGGGQMKGGQPSSMGQPQLMPRAGMGIG